MAERPLPHLSLRWSEHEARKPYARPFGVGFHGRNGAGYGSIAVSGPDLLYYGQFQSAVLALAGELFRDPRVEASGDPQRAWLDVLAAQMPVAPNPAVTPVSSFDQVAGRVFHCAVTVGPGPPIVVEPAQLLGYQDFQAAVAHQTGTLFRLPAVEAIDDPAGRQAAWIRSLDKLLSRPDPAEAMAPEWPWR